VRELTNLKIKLENAEKELKKFTEDPWIQDSNSNAEKPIFYNKVSGDIIQYPDDFKKSYKLTRKEGDVMVYVNEKGKEFKVPETLIIHQQKKKAPDALSTSTDDNKVGTKKDENVRQQYIFDVISKNGSLSVVEIGKITGILRNNIYADIDVMLENGLIIKDEDENDKYTTA
jgi:DNA-binding MarR family transcriptional regulator